MTEITYRGYRIGRTASGGVCGTKTAKGQDGGSAMSAKNVETLKACIDDWEDRGERKRYADFAQDLAIDKQTYDLLAKSIPPLRQASGVDLDAWGITYDERRPDGEPDEAYRVRLYAARDRANTPVTIGHKSRVYPWAAVVLGALAWIVLIAAVMAFKHWVFG